MRKKIKKKKIPISQKEREQAWGKGTATQNGTSDN